PCPPGFNGNTRRRCCRRTRDWINAFTLAGGRKSGNPGGCADMNTSVIDDLQVGWLGRVDFADAFALQEEIVLKKRSDSGLEDQLLLLEHDPVYTIGRTPDRSSLSVTARIRHEGLDAGHLPHPTFVTNRGGQATYHGPGQLIGYPIIDLRRCGQDLHR